jgi:RNA-directed DNA polymerase
MEKVVETLRPYVLGWKAYYGLAQTPEVWRELNKWLRHRLRAIQLKHWKRPKTTYRELKAIGAPKVVAKRVAAYSHNWWRNSAMLLNNVLTIACFDRMGVPDSHDLKLSNRRVRTRMLGGVAGVSSIAGDPLCRFI